MDDTELKKALFYALKATNLRPRSVEELKEKLKEKGFSDEVTDRVLSNFMKQGLLNDLKFSRLWLDSRMASRPKGAAALRRELKAKGVEKDVAEKALNLYKKEYDEYEVASGLARGRMRSLAGAEKTAAKRRLFGYLKRRGFSTEIIMRVIRENLGIMHDD